MCLSTHSIPQHIIIYICIHLHIYLHASYLHIHETKPRTYTITTNIYHSHEYVTILRIYMYRCYNNSIYNITHTNDFRLCH